MMLLCSLLQLCVCVYACECMCVSEWASMWWSKWVSEQGRSHHVLGGQVHKTARGVWGHAPPENFWDLEAKRLPL